MKKTEAYQCQYCNKLYRAIESCRSHENKCYYNPKTSSCASCAFFTQQEFPLSRKGHGINLQTCLVNINVLNARLKSKCDKFCERGKEKPEIMKEVLVNYKPDEIAKQFNRLNKERKSKISMELPIPIKINHSENEHEGEMSIF